ncbi:RidA family protein [Aestuariimicrobium soli]|uniref:RidA family protein n=1 Tax=Aestuariimicrobium soli TaxID=2035834 RepID=UPI003EB885EC
MPSIDIPGQPLPKVPLSMGYRAGNLLFVSGQVASDANGEIFIGDFTQEVERTLDNVEAVLTAGGATWKDVARVGVFLSNSLLFGPFNEVYAKRLGDHRPARSAIIVNFGHPNVRVEVEATAVLSDDDHSRQDG